MTKMRNLFRKMRGSKNPFWQTIVFAKDFVWKCANYIKRLPIQLHNKKMMDESPNYNNDASLNLGLSLWGYLNFRHLLDEKTQKIKIPENINQIKIDVGLSFAAPNSSLWLDKLSGRLVFGFEPNPENVQEILTGTNRKRGNGYNYIDLKHINKRFFLFSAAIDSDAPSIKTFYMTEKDPGTSSLYKPIIFKIKKVTQVPTIRLQDFLSLIPWERFDYIEHLKVDTQGNDLRVLQSAGNYLSQKIVFVTAECSAKNEYEYSHTESELDKFMSQNGFRFIENTNNAGNKTYVNIKFERFVNTLDYSTEE